MNKYITTISEGTFAKYLNEARPEIHHNTTQAHTSLCPVQTNVLLRQQAAGLSSAWYQSVAPLYYMYEYHSAAAVVVST